MQSLQQFKATASLELKQFEEEEEEEETASR